MVIDIITSGGNPDPPVLSRLFWALLQGAVAGTLLLGGGLVALQTATITTGLPFALIILGMCVALYKGLSAYAGPQEFHVWGYEKARAYRVRNEPPKMATFGRRRFW
jgi:choline/glycine/proline betaine transport protein